MEVTTKISEFVEMFGEGALKKILQEMGITWENYQEYISHRLQTFSPFSTRMICLLGYLYNIKSGDSAVFYSNGLKDNWNETITIPFRAIEKVGLVKIYVKKQKKDDR